MKRFLLFTLEFPPFFGGVAIYYANFVKYFDRGKIFILDNNKNEIINYNFVFLKWFYGLINLFKYIKEKKIDHVFVGHILPLGTITWFWSFFLDIDYSVFLHGMDFEFCKKYFRKKILAKLVLKRAKKIICVNSYIEKQVLNFLGEKYKEKIILKNPKIEKPNISDNKLISLKKEIFKKYNLKDKLVLFSVGRLVKRKGFDQVMKSIKNLNNRYDNLVYFLLGEGSDEKYLKNLKDELNLKDQQIIFLGRMSHDIKYVFFSLADIFLTPSRSIDGDIEGFGIVYLEANYFSCPVIAGNSGGVRDAVRDAYNGFVVDGNNLSELENKMKLLIQDENLRKRMGKQGRDRVLEKFLY